MTEDEKLRADYAASVSLLTQDERDQLWENAKAFCMDWFSGRIPHTPENSARFETQIDILTVDCDADALVKFIDAMGTIKAMQQDRPDRSAGG